MYLRSIPSILKSINNSKLLIVPCCTTNVKRGFYLNSRLEALVPFHLSDIGEGIREVIVKEWFVKVGDKVSQFDNICEVQSDKASVTITSRYDGIVQKLYYNIDEVALVGKPLINIETNVNNETLDNSFSAISNQEIVTFEDQKKIHVAKSQEQEVNLCIPSVRRLIKEHNINISLIKGTGKKGRILKEDVLKFLDNNKQLLEINQNTVEDRVEPLRGFQKIMMKTMTESLKIPHLVYGDEMDVTNLSKLKNQINESLEDKDLRVSYLPFIIKSVSNALKEYPILNAILDDNNDNIIYKKNHNISIAMDTELGLAVPVIKNVQSLNIFEINEQLKNLVKSGRKGQFSVEELTGGTFTISNIGSIGGTYAKPVILPPQLCLLALGSIRLLPRFNESKEITAQEIVNISAAADHRIIDGATMARFIKVCKKQLQNPLSLVIGL